MEKEINDEHVISNLDTACSMLKESFWKDKNKNGAPIMQYFSSNLFLDKENVKRMAAAVAVNLRWGYENLLDTASISEIQNYEQEVKSIKTQFKRGINYKLQEAKIISPEEVEKAELKNKIKDSINELGTGNI